MFKILALVQNENMKIYRRVRTWIMIAILLIIQLVMALLMATVSIFNHMDHMLEFMNISTYLIQLVVIFAIVIAGDIVASEFSWGTVKLLLIRPAKRWKILLSKYIAVLLFSILLLLFVLIWSVILGLLLFGMGGDISNDLSFAGILADYGFKFIDLVMTLTFCFMISTVFRSSALAIALSYIILFVGSGIVGFLSNFYTWPKYILFANMDLSMYFGDGRPIIEGMTLGFSITMLVLYFIVFHFVSFYTFKKRDVAV